LKEHETLRLSNSVSYEISATVNKAVTKNDCSSVCWVNLCTC